VAAIMIIHGNSLLKVIVMVVTASLLSCGEGPPPASQPKVVREKIASQTVQPQQDASTPETNPPAEAASQAGGEEAPSQEGGPITSDLIQQSLEIASSYDPKGRFDPFEPLFKEQPQVPLSTGTTAKRKKRIAQTPLERVALSQLKLSAIIRAATGNRALVVDATGKGYVVVNGTYIGLNSGKVIQIDKDRIVVEEEMENVLGELTVQNTELKLQKPAGEF
jgi:type IV pilus assembly protein PilP